MKKNILAAIVLGSLSANVLAYEPQSIPLDNGINITPTLGVTFKQDDNILFQPANEEDSFITLFTPSIAASLDDGVNQYGLTYIGNKAIYASSSDDNYFDHYLALTSALSLSELSSVDAGFTFNKGHEPRGTGVTEGAGDNVAEPVEFSDYKLYGVWNYGLSSSNGSIELKADYYDKEYDNFRELTASKDYSSVTFGGTFFYQTGAGGELFAEARYSDIEYDTISTGDVSRDSEDTRLFVGVKWEATALTTGSFRLGYQQKDFAAAGREDFDGLSWEGEVVWSPLSYSQVTFMTSRASKDPNVVGDYIKETNNYLAWQHALTERVGINASFSKLEEDYVGVTRKDTTDTISVGASYDFSRNAMVNASFARMDKSSNAANISFEQNVFSLGVTIGL